MFVIFLFSFLVASIARADRFRRDYVRLSKSAIGAALEAESPSDFTGLDSSTLQSLQTLGGDTTFIYALLSEINGPVTARKIEPILQFTRDQFFDAMTSGFSGHFTGLQRSDLESFNEDPNDPTKIEFVFNVRRQ